jgi:hypothetical protein
VKRKIIVLTVAVAVLFVSVQLFADYDREAVVSAMRTNGAMMGALKTAVAEEDYFAAAEAFMGIAQTTRPLLSLNPPKGSKAEWDRIHRDVIKAAFRGIGACAEEDMEEVGKHFGEIGALVGEGHGTFR